MPRWATASARLTRLTAIASLAFAAPAIAQDAEAMGPMGPGEQAIDTTKPSWSNDQVAAFVEAMGGHWVSDDAVAGERNAQGRLRATFAPMSFVGQDGEPIADTIYYELVGEDNPGQPLSAAFFQVFADGDAIRLRRFEFRFPALGAVLAGAWAVPFEHRPQGQAGWGDAVLDITLEGSGRNFASSGVASGPITVPQLPGLDRIAMEIELDGDFMMFHERLMGPNGEEVLVPAGDPPLFRRVSAPVRMMNMGDGLMAFDIGEGSGMELVENGWMQVDYSAWVAQSPSPFDSTIPDNRTAYTTRVPRIDGESNVEGFDMGSMGLRAGVRRWIVVPADLGFGDRPERRIPPNSTLVYAIDAQKIWEPQPDTDADETEAPADDEG